MRKRRLHISTLDANAPTDRSNGAAHTLPSLVADRLSLRNHIALDCMRRGAGSASSAQAMLEMLLSAGLLVGLGYCTATRQLIYDAERSLTAASQRGLATRQWTLSDDEFEVLREVIAEHDKQLYRAPTAKLVQVFEKIGALAQIKC
jgi:hypothetical protein